MSGAAAIGLRAIFELLEEQPTDGKLPHYVVKLSQSIKSFHEASRPSTTSMAHHKTLICLNSLCYSFNCLSVPACLI